jgi:FtsZ-binding cell division protein ZapB
MKRIFYTAPSTIKALFFLFFLAVNVDLSAQASLSVQGVLTKSDGTAVDDGNDYVLTFRLWESESGTDGSDRVHLETIDNISIVGGVYSVVLGLNPASPLTAAFDQTYWLGVSVGTSSVELLPRPRLTHAPYALGLVGQNNVFPSTGPVIGDAFRAKGGPATGGLGANANGFAFQDPSGDQSGGMFSEGANNVELWAGAAKRVKLNTVQNEMYGNLVNFGTLTSNAQTINGDQTVNGFSTIANGQTVNGVQTINSNQFVNGFSTVTANQTVDGIVRAGGGIVNKAFTNTGMFWGAGNRDISINSNNNQRILIGDNGITYFNGPNIFTSGDFKLWNIPEFDGKNMQWNQATGTVGWDNSSRRFKRNIKTLEDDWCQILNARPVSYTRKHDPNKIEVGYIAEEMDSLGLKKLVEYDQEGIPDGFNYEKMIVYVTEVLKLQDASIKHLEAEVNALKTENSGLTAQNNSLKNTNASLHKQQELFHGQLEGLLKRMQALEATSTGK